MLADHPSTGRSQLPNLRALSGPIYAVYTERLSLPGMEAFRAFVKGRANRGHPLPVLWLDMLKEAECGINVLRRGKECSVALELIHI